MSQGFTGAGQGAARLASTASTASLTLPAGPMIATYPISGTSPITAITAAQDGRLALLEFASTGCRVVMGGNLLINGDYLSSVSGVLMLIANGGNWEEVTRTSAILQPYNACPNGGFEGWQFGTSFAAIADAVYFADRWVSNKSGAGIWTIAQDSSVPAVAWNAAAASWSAKVTVTTADASIAAGDLYAIYTAIEGYDIRDLMNGFAVSWWARAHRTGTYCASFVNKAFNRSYIVEYTIAVADTWQYFTAVVPAPIGTWTLDTQIGMYCLFSLAMGSTFGSGASASTWLSTGSYTTANQINGVAATSDTFSLWGLNVVPGTVPQPYHPMPFPLLWERLRRYCQKFAAGTSGAYATSFSNSTTDAYAVLYLPTSMLGVPTSVFSAASTFWHYQLSGTFTPTAIVTAAAGPDRVRCYMSGMSGLTNGAAGLMMDSGAGSSSILLTANPT
jgi:hypothetical protein